MLDKERILSKIDELEQYMIELKSVAPSSYSEYVENIEKKRSCERLLHIMIECVIDICTLIVKGMKLGLPTEEEDLFEKLRKRNVITSEMKEILKKMKGFRNILVHMYSEVNDGLVFENLKNIKDFEKFKKQILKFLKG